MVAFYLVIMDNIASGEDNNYTRNQINKLYQWEDNDKRSERVKDAEIENYVKQLDN